MAKKVDFFLGANSANGFYGLYEQLERNDKVHDFLILTGGPGVGKSTFMKYIGKYAEKAGIDIEYIHCSGDPDSLDAVILPELGVIVADGTDPHALKPKYPVAVDRYVDLGRFYNVDRIKERKREIIACTDGYQDKYKKAYACLQVARAVRREMEQSLEPWFNGEKAWNRIRNIWVRERGKKRDRIGKEEKRFLGGCTANGRIWYRQSITSLCKKVYELQDTYHLGAPLLRKLGSMIREDGYDIILCMNPDSPERIDHVLVPELEIGFVTTDDIFSLERKAYRKVRFDQMIDRESYRELRGALRLKGRLANALEDEGTHYLYLAKAKHDELELIYRPFVNFEGVSALAEDECRRIFKK